MKFISAVFIVFSILLVANFSCATRDLGDYWKNMMKGQAMPEAIKELVQESQASDAGKDRFIRDFDIKPNVILYHTHVGSTKQKQNTFVKNQDHGSRVPWLNKLSERVLEVPILNNHD